MIFDEIWKGEKIRQIGIRATGLTQTNHQQLDLFSPVETQIQREKLDCTIDLLRRKYGNNAIHRGRFLETQINPMIGGTFGAESHRPRNGLPV